MDLISSLLAAMLFVAFVPGVLTRIPPGGTKATVLVVHAILFSLVTSAVMYMYWGWREGFGNYGEVCPNGYLKTESGDCIAAGGPTYSLA
jgi:hypothetical protein